MVNNLISTFSLNFVKIDWVVLAQFCFLSNKQTNWRRWKHNLLGEVITNEATQGRAQDFSKIEGPKAHQSGVRFWVWGSNPSPPGRWSGRALWAPQRGSGQSPNRSKVFHYFQHSRMASPETIIFTLRAKLSDAVYCYRSCLQCVCNGRSVFVGGSVTTITWNCVHRSSPNWVCR